jgi:flagellar biogenesis protein FliO
MEYLQQMLAVLAVFGILGGALWWLRRRGLARFATTGQQKGTKVLAQIERLPLSATHSLHLVRMADRAILIASWPGGCQAIESSGWNHLAQTNMGQADTGKPQ